MAFQELNRLVGLSFIIIDDELHGPAQQSSDLFIFLPNIRSPPDHEALSARDR